MNKGITDFISGKTNVLTRAGGPPITFTKAAPLPPQPQAGVPRTTITQDTIGHLPSKEEILNPSAYPRYGRRRYIF